MSSLNPECYAEFFIKKATLSPFPFFLCPATIVTINTHILITTEFCEKPRNQFLREPLLSCGLRFLFAISMTFSHMSKLRFVRVGISSFFFMKTKYIYSWILSVFFHLKYSILGRKKYLVANIALRDEKVAASSFKAFSSFLSFVIVSVTIAFSFSYLFFRLARATSAVWSTKSQCLLTHTRKTCSTHFFMPNLFFAFINGNRNCLGWISAKASIYIEYRDVSL